MPFCMTLSPVSAALGGTGLDGVANAGSRLPRLCSGDGDGGGALVDGALGVAHWVACSRILAAAHFSTHLPRASTAFGALLSVSACIQQSPLALSKVRYSEGWAGSDGVGARVARPAGIPWRAAALWSSPAVSPPVEDRPPVVSKQPASATAVPASSRKRQQLVTALRIVPTTMITPTDSRSRPVRVYGKPRASSRHRTADWPF